MRNVCTVIAVALLFTTPVLAGPDLNAAGSDLCKCLQGPQTQVRKMMTLTANKCPDPMSRVSMK